MKFGARWSELRWLLTWATSPAPLSWLLIGCAFALGVWGLFAIMALPRFDRAYALVTSGRCVWIASPVDTARTAAPDTIRRIP